MSKKKPQPGTIAVNRRARHDYQIEDTFDAGLVLEGWEVKSIRAGRAQLNESYVVLKHSEAWLIGAHISPLTSTSTHVHPDPVRSRKLLLTQRELGKLFGAVQREGYTVVPLKLYWSRQYIKLSIAVAKGKKHYDKRETLKRKEWDREKQRIMKKNR